jgi:hypothetical protein
MNTKRCGSVVSSLLYEILCFLEDPEDILLNEISQLENINIVWFNLYEVIKFIDIR